MRYKIIVGFLVLVIVILLGFNVYYYSAVVAKQAMVNNMRGYITVAWAWQMADISFYLQNATTNTDMHLISELLRAASKTGEAAWFHYSDLYWQMANLPDYVSTEISPYCEGSPIFIKRINSTAIEMIRNLAQRISDTALLVINLDMDLRQEGGDPIQLLKEKGVLDSIINGCENIRNLSQQIYDFNPKFQ